MLRVLVASLFCPILLFSTTIPARATVDLTGSFSVVAETILGSLELSFEFVQTGTQVQLSYRQSGGPPAGPYTGTIDPDTGVFTIPLPDGGYPIVCTGNQIAGTASADGQSIGGYWTAYFDSIHLFCQNGGGSFAGQRNVCGDGIVGGNEACDDGNVADGDCCSADCSTSAPDATPCDDGDACTNGDHCAAGICAAATMLFCQPCESCSPDGCVISDDKGCAPALAGGKSSISIRHDAGAPQKDTLTWNWKNGVPVTISDFGPVSGGTNYHLCVIDHTGGVPTLRMSRTLPGGSNCQSPDGFCWKTKTAGFTFRSRSGLPDGLTTASLKAGPVGKGKITVKGKGAALAAESDLTGLVTVRLERDDGQTCWDATYSSSKTVGTTFKAKSD